MNYFGVSCSIIGIVYNEDLNRFAGDLIVNNGILDQLFLPELCHNCVCYVRRQFSWQLRFVASDVPLLAWVR